MKPNEPDSVLKFYQDLASEYHHIFADWKQSVLWQGEVLDGIIRAALGKQPASLLDCTCGIGTQAIGLALRGYTVHATDLSPVAVERARREAASFGVTATFGVADVRTMAAQVPGSFEAVIACDNSLPHLLNDEDLRQAVHNVGAKLPANGLFLASIRDYDQITAEKPCSTMPRVFDDPEGRRIAFQVWDWSQDGRAYVVHQFMLKEVEGDWQAEHYVTQYRALLRHELSQCLREAGFSNIEWQMPAESGYYQPIVIARKR
jgi:glycine/sarcosine N-methyltransferase